ncbi:MAG: hypothetical protein ABII00_05865 [Elusimicrobiota bacterium]
MRRTNGPRWVLLAACALSLQGAARAGTGPRPSPKRLQEEKLPGAIVARLPVPAAFASPGAPASTLSSPAVLLAREIDELFAGLSSETNDGTRALRQPAPEKAPPRGTGSGRLSSRSSPAAGTREPAEVFAALDRRLSDIRARIIDTIDDPEEVAILLARVDRIRGVLAKLRRAGETGQARSLSGAMAGLARALGRGTDDENLSRFETLVDRLMQARSLPPDRLGTIFDNTPEFPDSDVLAPVPAEGFKARAPRARASGAGVSQAALLDIDRYPRPLTGIRVDGGVVPKPRGPGTSAKAEPESEVGRPQRRAVTASQGLERSAVAALSPFAGLSPKGRQDLFRKDRAALRRELLAVGLRALEEGDAELEPYREDLDAADGRLSGMRKALLARLGFDAPPHNDQERSGRFATLTKEAPHLSLYFARRGIYQMRMRQAHGEHAVPPETRFAPWELGIEDGSEKAVVYATAKDGDRTFYGLRREFQDGSSRFAATDGAEGLVVVVSPSDSREIRTRIRFDDQGRPDRTRTSIIDTGTGKRIREEIADIARALTRFVDYDQAGDAVRVLTLDSGTGEQVVEDRRQGRRVATDKDGKVTITPIRGGAQAWQQQGRLDESGRFILDRLVREDGSVVERVSPHVLKISRDGKAQGYEIVVDSIFHGARGPEREAESSRIAREIIAALGYQDKDDRRSRPLSNWLSDTWTKDERTRGVAMTVDPRGRFQVVYSYKDGTKRIERAKYGLSTSYGDGKRELALVTLRPVHTDRQGRARLDPRRYREYLAGGGYNQWHSTFEFKKAGWFSNAKTIEHVSLIRYGRDGSLPRLGPGSGGERDGDSGSGRWTERGREKKDEFVNEVGGTSTFGIVGTAIHEAPVVGDVLQAGGAVGKTLWTGIMAAPPTFIYAVTKDTDYGLAMSGSYAKNPLVNRLVGDQGHLDRMDGKMWEVVLIEARENRRKDLDQMGYTEGNTDPEEHQRLLSQWRGDRFVSPEDCLKSHPRGYCDRFRYSREELMRAVRGYGALTWGDRLIESAEGKKGAAYCATAGAGWGLKVFENVGETLFNPVIWATFGVGKGVQAMTAMRAAGNSSLAVSGALSTARVTHALLSTTLYSTWVVGGVDNLGQTVVALQEGDREQALKKSADLGTDLFFVWMMARESRSHKLRQKARQALLKEQRLITKEYKAASKAVRTKSAHATNGKAPVKSAEKALQSKAAHATNGKAPVKSAEKALQSKAAHATNGKAPVKSAEKAIRSKAAHAQKPAKPAPEPKTEAARGKTTGKGETRATSGAPKKPAPRTIRERMHEWKARLVENKPRVMDFLKKRMPKLKSSQASKAKALKARQTARHTKANRAKKTESKSGKNAKRGGESPLRNLGERVVAVAKSLISKGKTTGRKARNAGKLKKAAVAPRAILSPELNRFASETEPVPAPDPADSDARYTADEEPGEEAGVDPGQRGEDDGRAARDAAKPRAEPLIGAGRAADSPAGAPDSGGDQASPGSGGDSGSEAGGGETGSGTGSGALGGGSLASGSGSGGSGGGRKGAGRNPRVHGRAGQKFDGGRTTVARLTPTSPRPLPSLQPERPRIMPRAPEPIDPYRQAHASPERRSVPPVEEKPAPRVSRKSSPPGFNATGGSGGSLAPGGPEFKPRDPFPEGRKAAPPATPSPPRTEARSGAPAAAAASPAAHDGFFEIPRHRLRPAGHLPNGRLPERGQESPYRAHALSLLLELAGLGAAIYLFRLSRFPFLIGIARKRL